MLLDTKIMKESPITFIMASNLLNLLNKDVYSFIVGIIIEKQIKELHGYQSTTKKLHSSIKYINQIIFLRFLNLQTK